MCEFGIVWPYSLEPTLKFQQWVMYDRQRLRPVCAYAHSDQSLCWSLEYSRLVKLVAEHHLEFLSLKGGCSGSSESIHVKMPQRWKSYVATQSYFLGDQDNSRATYCEFRHYRKNFIFANSEIQCICDVKHSRLGYDLLTPVNDSLGVIAPKIKASRKFPNLH